MRDSISTILHKLMEHYPGIEELETLTQLPHYVMDAELMVQLPHRTVVQSLVALHESSLFTLPFPTVLLECWAGQRDRIIAAITQQGPNDFRAITIGFVAGKMVPPAPMIFSWITRDEAMTEWTMRPSMQLYDGKGDGGPRPILSADDITAGFRAEIPREGQKMLSILAGELATALSLLLLLPHIAGLEREVVEPRKLNEARRRSGKVSIPTHTTVRVGHVYDKRGLGHKVVRGTRSPMPIHMRAAHTRRQHHGPQFLEEHPEIAKLPTTTAEHHLVLIPAVLVNYKDGTNLETPLPKLVKF